MKRNGIVVNSAYATREEGGGKLSEKSRKIILALLRRENKETP